MSLLKKLWESIKHLFGAIAPELKTAIHIGVVITEGLETVVVSPAADILTVIIPGNTDDEVKVILRQALPKIVVDLKLVEATEGLTDPNEIMANAVKVFQDLDPSVKPAFLHSLSILVAQVAADGKLSWSDGVYLLQWYYENEYKQLPDQSSSDSNSINDEQSTGSGN